MAVEAYFNANTVWVSEVDKYANKVIDTRINKPNLGNLKVIDWHNVEPIDILTAGYPCQPFSKAGARRGADDERHLWPYIKTAISILRPRIVVLENVRGHFSLGFREVLGDLASIGYDARWTVIQAKHAGAPHRRERLFIVAYPDSLPRDTTQRGTSTIYRSAGQEFDWTNRNEHGSSFENVEYSDTDSIGLSLVTDDSRKVCNQGQSRPIPSELVAQIYRRSVPTPLDQGKLNVRFVEYMMGLPDGWVTDIDLTYVQMLKILGNGVVPQQAYKAIDWLMNYE